MGGRGGRSAMKKVEAIRNTRLGLDQLQDNCKTWSLNPGFCFYGCASGYYGYYAIRSSNHQLLSLMFERVKNEQTTKHTTGS